MSRLTVGMLVNMLEHLPSDTRLFIHSSGSGLKMLTTVVIQLDEGQLEVRLYGDDTIEPEIPQ